MPEVKEDVKSSVASVPATPSPVPAQKEQPAPAAAPKSGEPSKPVDVKPQETTVPLPALQEERSKRQALEAEVAELRKLVSSQPAPQPAQQQADPRKELDELWDTDPRKAVDMSIMYAMDWRDRVDSSLEIQADQLARKYPDFNNFRSTALGQVRSLPLNQRGNAGILEAAYFMVKGQNFDNLMQQRENELLEKYRRGEISAQGLTTPPGSFSAPSPAPSVQLTDEQIRVADAMGLTPEQYASQMKVRAS